MTEKLDPRQVVTLGRLIVGLLTMVVVGVGCSHGSWSASRRDTTNLVPEDSITLILYADGLHPYSNERETEVVECITDELADTHPTVHIIPPDIFRRVAFPDLASEEILPADRTWKNVVVTCPPQIGPRCGNTF